MGKPKPSGKLLHDDSEIRGRLLDLLKQLATQGKQDEKRHSALFLVPEAIMFQALQTVIGDEISEINEAIEFLQWDFLDPRPLRISEETHERIVAFPTVVPALELEWLQIFWNHEQQARALPEDQRTFSLQSVDLLRQWVCQEASSFPDIIPEHEARALLLPVSPYHTSLGTVTVSWNNGMIRSTCPFCSALFKPAWGLWPFLETETGGAICVDCWRLGAGVVPTVRGTI